MASIQVGTLFVRLSYSTDSGTNWLPASPVDLKASEFALTVPIETAIEQQFDYKRRKRKVSKGRPRLYVKFDADNFGAVHDSSDAKLQHVEDWLRQSGGLLRVFTHDGAASPTGVSPENRNYFATANNTNYVLPVNEGDEPDIVSMFVKRFELVVETRDVL